MTRITATFLLLAGILLAQDDKPALERAAQSVAADNLKKHLTYLACDELEGRNSGYPGNEKAAEYIAEHFKKIGLKPVGDKNDKGEPTYFQAFSVFKMRTRNVLGYLEGSDETLKKELVVVGAHFDHVGKKGQKLDAGRMNDDPTSDQKDEIWNGADDNGSGTATVLEAARALMESKVRPKRSILIILFSGEEYGLLGSIHYCERPVFPLADTVAMINLDMVGRNPNRRVEIGGVGTSGDWEDLIKRAAEGTGLKYQTAREVSQGSDHYSFAQKRVPAVHFFTGFHKDYHCPTDHADRLAYDNMEKVGRATLRLAVLVADAPARPAPSFKAAPKKLGITGDDLDDREAAEYSLPKGEGGIRLSSIAAGSVAEAAGFESGDVLVEFAGKKLPRDQTTRALRDLIAGVKAGESVTAVVIRGGGRATLTVKWPSE